MERHTDEAFKWVEETIGGTIVDKRQQDRWRPQWFLKVEKPGGEIVPLVLRGFRNPGVIDTEEASRARLKREAGIVTALQDTPVKVAKYYGYCDTGDWFLMEWLSGEEMLTQVEDTEERYAIFRTYMENVAVLHNLDVDALDLPADVERKRTKEEILFGKSSGGEALFRQLREERPEEPEPLIELGLWWVYNHPPKSETRTGLCAGDIGPDQFFFENGELKAMFDLEIASIGDPYCDLGLMRLREMCYPIGKMPDHIRHYAAATGRPLDVERLQYWTVVGMLQSPMVFWDKTTRPDPCLPDMALIYSCDPIHTRGLCEALLQIYGMTADKPERPKDMETTRTKLHELMAGQIKEFYLPNTEDTYQQFCLRASAALAESLSIGNAIGPQLEEDDIEDMAAVLGSRPNSHREGLFGLEALIKADPEKHIERLLPALYRMEVRGEWLLEPIQKATGFSHGVPLDPLS